MKQPGESDDLLLVARPEKLEKTAAKYCIETLQQAQINLFGVFLNGLLVKYEPNGYYYYLNYYHGGCCSNYKSENNKAEALQNLVN